MKLHINQQRKLWWGVSGSLMIISLLCMIISFFSLQSPLRLGLDFVGGTRLQLERDCGVADCSEPLQLTTVRNLLGEQGLASSGIQILGDERQALSIRTPSLSTDDRAALQSRLEEALGPFAPDRTQVDTVGPVIGQRLLVGGLLALGVAFGGIVLYLSFRFQWDYAVLAIVALFHDVFITAGLFSALGLISGVEIDSLFLVALLTIAGFSVNDTVVIYDRIREMLKREPDQPINVVVDDAVNETLARSINTTLTTLLPLVAIFIFGGATLKTFSLALITGFILGAYSSIFVASSLLSWWREKHPQPIPAAIAEADPDEPRSLNQI
ncbi:MAG: protein translocase subunit SecF [Prochlorotrichaceae cyanobacterium]